MEPIGIYSLGEKCQARQVLTGAVRQVGEGIVQGNREGLGAAFFLRSPKGVESLPQGIDQRCWVLGLQVGQNHPQ